MASSFIIIIHMCRALSVFLIPLCTPAAGRGPMVPRVLRITRPVCSMACTICCTGNAVMRLCSCGVWRAWPRGVVRPVRAEDACTTPVGSRVGSGRTQQDLGCRRIGSSRTRVLTLDYIRLGSRPDLL